MYALIYGNLDCAFSLMRNKRMNTQNEEVFVNHCGEGINLVDENNKNALFYAIQAGY